MKNRFPNGHIGMEIVLQRGTWPMKMGTFHFDFLKPNILRNFPYFIINNDFPFDYVWELVTNNEGIYIVSWNDHYFF